MLIDHLKKDRNGNFVTDDFNSALCILTFSEGYESLVRARSGVTATCATDTGVSSASVEPSSDAFDMFAEDDEHSTAKPSSEEGNMASAPDSDGVGQSSSHTSNTHSESELFSSYPSFCGIIKFLHACFEPCNYFLYRWSSTK